MTLSPSKCCGQATEGARGLEELDKRDIAEPRRAVASSPKARTVLLAVTSPPTMRVSLRVITSHGRFAIARMTGWSLSERLCC
jgi:hypothetical protein